MVAVQRTRHGIAGLVNLVSQHGVYFRLAVIPGVTSRVVVVLQVIIGDIVNMVVNVRVRVNTNTRQQGVIRYATGSPTHGRAQQVPLIPGPIHLIGRVLFGYCYSTGIVYRGRSGIQGDRICRRVDLLDHQDARVFTLQHREINCDIPARRIRKDQALISNHMVSRDGLVDLRVRRLQGSLYPLQFLLDIPG